MWAMIERFLPLLSRMDFWIYVTMGVVYLWAVKLCLLPPLSISRSLKRGIKRIRLREENGAFVYNRPDFLACKALNEWWSRYIVNLNEMKKSYGELDVSGFINHQTAIQGPGHSQFAEIVPGVMTSLGILGTFSGLVTGVSKIDLSTSEVMRASIAQLIGGMRTAFITSIVGVILAISFQLIRRFIVSKAANILNRFILECHTVISMPYTQETKLIQTMYALLTEFRKSNSDKEMHGRF